MADLPQSEHMTSISRELGLLGVSLGGTLSWLALFGLKDAPILSAGVAAVCYFAAAFHFSRPFAFFKKARPRAWVLTLACATPLGPFGAYRATSMILSGAIMQQAAHFTSDPLSQAATVMFVAFLVCDTVYGAAHYPSQFELIAGWVHHAVYLVFFALCVRWKITAAVALTFPLELTTIVLALGHIHPPLRSDWLFGASFFALRICYHSWMVHIYYARLSDPPVTVWPFMVAVLLLHIHWFIKWVQGMARRGRSDKRT